MSVKEGWKSTGAGSALTPGPDEKAANKAEHWHDVVTVLRCPNADACLAGSRCAPGYGTPLCAMLGC